jgi:hypothetical protein
MLVFFVAVHVISVHFHHDISVYCLKRGDFKYPICLGLVAIFYVNITEKMKCSASLADAVMQHKPIKLKWIGVM